MTEALPDDLDRAIIRELESDGRRPFREIARSLDVSEATIRARFRRLTETGTLKIVAFSDPAAMAKDRLALLFMKVAPESHDAVSKALTARAEVSYVSTVLGSFDLFAQVLVSDDTALWTFLQEVVRPMPGVLDTECTVEVNVHKLWFENAT
jgi:Lrp/AsnC family transcriptional regulator for asnA, asnC and gidA